MKGASIILCALICLAAIRLADPDPVPLSITAALFPAGGDWCDVPVHRAPILDSPRHRLDYRQGRPYGDRGDA